MDADDPYAYFDACQKQGDIYWDEAQTHWKVLSYEATCDLLKEPNLSSDNTHVLLDSVFPSKDRENVKPLTDYLKQWFFYRDPPEHTQLRRTMSAQFSAESVTRFEPEIKRVVNAVLSEASGTIDFMDAVAHPITSRVIAIFLGLPEKDAPLFLRWTLAIGEFLDAMIRTPAEYKPALAALKEQEAYFSKDDDWIQKAMLIATGIETTLSLLGSTAFTFINNPDQWQQLKVQPELMEQAIDELLRFEPPVLRCIRHVTSDFEYKGHKFSKDDLVFLYLAAANRDPKYFESPNTFDITRQSTLNLSFGYGIHYCLGRLLGRTVLRAFLEAFILDDSFEKSDRDVIWHSSGSLRRLSSFWVRKT